MDMEQESLNEFAQRLRDLRKERGLSARQLAEKTRISNVTIIDWENQKCVPKLDLVIRLAKSLDVSIDYLCWLKDF